MAVHERLHPDEAMKAIERMRAEDMRRYADPKTGLVAETLSEPMSACPACGSDERAPAFTKEVFAYLRCESCGCVHVARRLNDAELDRLYGEQGRSVYQMVHLYIPTAEQRLDRIYRRKARALRERFGAGRLLDFGCSAGLFMKAAAEQGFDVHGVETNETAVEHARTALDLTTVWKGDLPGAGYAPESFDIITMWDVLEHVPDPKGLIEHVRPYLKPSGRLVIETSHIDCFEADYLGADNTNVVGDVHLAHFTRASLERLAERTGMRLAEASIFGLDVAHIVNERRRRLGEQTDTVMPADLIQALQDELDRAGRGCYIRVELERG